MKKHLLLHLYYLAPSKRASVEQLMAQANIDVKFSQSDISPAKVDALFVGAHELSSAILNQFKQLKVIQVLGTNTALIDLEYCHSNGITVLRSQEPRGHLIAEHAISLALSCIRRLPQADIAVRNWQMNDDFPTVKASETQGYDNWPRIQPQSLFDSTVGILGAGTIALEIIQRLHAFGCDINYHKRTHFSSNVEQKLGINYLTLEQILTNSDILFVQLPLTDSTRSLINSENIHLLKHGAIIVNCGRAAVIDETTFMQAIENKQIGYAGLDVFWHEPLPAEHALTKNNNVILTPHMAEIGGRDVSLLRKEALEQLITFF